eukprot:6002522-Amphidinium_carterae.1
MDGERERRLEEVKRYGPSLANVPKRYRADREIVLAAVQESGRALQYAAEECKADREIVLEAVQQNGYALAYAGEECKADREIAWTAVQEDPLSIGYAADELLLDSTFASEAKQDWYILHISLLSGRSTVVMSEGDAEDLVNDSAEAIVGRCCSRLQIQRRGGETLVHGTEVVPATAEVPDWPGIRPPGEVSEYQLVVQ